MPTKPNSPTSPTKPTSLTSPPPRPTLGEPRSALRASHVLLARDALLGILAALLAANLYFAIYDKRRAVETAPPPVEVILSNATELVIAVSAEAPAAARAGGVLTMVLAPVLTPVLAPLGTAARPMAPLSRMTSASTVGLPRESRISRA